MNRTNRVFADLNLLRVFLTIWDVRISWLRDTLITRFAAGRRPAVGQ